MKTSVYQSIEQKRKQLEKKRKEIQEGHLNAVREMVKNEDIEGICQKAGYKYRNRLFSPVVTILHMIGAAISREGTFQSSWHNSGYTGHSDTLAHARKRLPLSVWKEMGMFIGNSIEDEFGSKELWRGHRVLGVDGTCTSMSDVPHLIEHFGRAGSKEGQSRFPINRGVIVFAFNTFRIIDHEFGPYTTGENKLFEILIPRLRKNDLIVADRRYAGAKRYVDYSRSGIEYITRAHQRLHVEKLRIVKELGKDDFFVELPIQRIYRNQDSALPENIIVRVIKTQTKIRGKKEIIWLVTSLLNALIYPADEIKMLYKKRWKVEGLIEELKIWLGTDILRSRTVEGIYKELYARIISYNLIHWLILKAAKKHNKRPERISTAATLRLTACYSLKMSTASAWHIMTLYEQLLDNIAYSDVPYRPDRIEPRLKKRDQKHYSVLKISRVEWRAINGIAA